MFEEVGMEALIEKSKKLTGYLEFIIHSVSNKLEVITPSERGCQLSIIAHGMGKSLHDKLTAEGVIADWREPNVIRCAPVPMYNSFEDVYRFGEILKGAIS